MKIILSTIILAVMSGLLIFYRFGEIPSHMAFDEVEFAKLALSLNEKPYGPYSPLATGHSTLYFYILSFSLNLFGVSATSLRLPAAVFGVGSTVVLYLLLLSVFKKNAPALLGGVLFVSSHWFLNFARFSFEGTFLIFLELISLLFTLTYIGKRENYQLILAGIFAGLAFHSYYPGRIFFILPSLVILKASGIKKFFYFVAIFFLTALPLIISLLSRPDTRIYQTTFLTNPELSIGDKLQMMVTNLLKTILIPFTNGDMNGRHNFPGKPAINLILGFFLTCGFLLTSTFENKKIKQIVFFYLFISVLPTLFTNPADNPNMLRTITALPAITYLICCGIWSIYLLTTHLFPEKKLLSIGLISIAIIVSITYEFRTYFVFQQRVMKNSFEITCPLEQLVKKTHILPECRVKSNLF